MLGLPFYLYKALSMFIMPLGLGLTLLIFSGIFLFLKRKKTVFVLMTILFVWLWLWSTPVWCNFLQRRIESKYSWRPAASYPVADAIVSLGGGINGAPVKSPPQQPAFDLNAAADREIFATQLYYAGKSKVIIVTSGADPVRGKGVAALAQKKFLEMLGVPAQAIKVEGKSLNTIDNAREVKKMLEPVAGKTILLVTSAQHMPRSYWLFQQTGLKVIPAPTDFESFSAPFSVNQLLPDASSLDGSTRAYKELVGLWVMKVMGVY